MCGIVGAIIKSNYGPTKAQEDAFYDMLTVDVLRGDDSTGAILVEKDSSYSIYKDYWQPWWVIPSMRATEGGKNMFQKGKAFIGHNRKATVGAVTPETAHPFVVDDVFSLVHNGTLRNYTSLGEGAVSDSHALAQHLRPVLGANYTKEAFEEAIGKVEGAYAVVCYNQETHKVYMFRNSERPLALIETNDGFYFGSEFGLIQWILGRESLLTKDAKSELVQMHCLYTFDLSTNTLTKEEYVPKKAPSPVYTTGPSASPTKSTPVISIGAGDIQEKPGTSKNKYKQLKRKLIGTQIKFWADDVVEENFPKTVADGETSVLLMGESEEINVSHWVVGATDITSLNTSIVVDAAYLGRVYDIDYNKDTGVLTVKVDQVRPMPRSLSPFLENEDETSSIVH